MSSSCNACVIRLLTEEGAFDWSHQWRNRRSSICGLFTAFIMDPLNKSLHCITATKRVSWTCSCKDCLLCIVWQVYKAEHTREIVSYSAQITQICPQEGWLEHNPIEILRAVRECISCGVESLEKLGYGVEDIVTIGISNQRETTIAWDAVTGEPLYNAIGELLLVGWGEYDYFMVMLRHAGMYYISDKLFSFS